MKRREEDERKAQGEIDAAVQRVFGTHLDSLEKSLNDMDSKRQEMKHHHEEMSGWEGYPEEAQAFARAEMDRLREESKRGGAAIAVIRRALGLSPSGESR